MKTSFDAWLKTRMQEAYGYGLPSSGGNGSNNGLANYVMQFAKYRIPEPLLMGIIQNPNDQSAIDRVSSLNNWVGRMIAHYIRTGEDATQSNDNDGW